jgi:hypothetical protein
MRPRQYPKPVWTLETALGWVLNLQAILLALFVLVVILGSFMTSSLAWAYSMASLIMVVLYPFTIPQEEPAFVVVFRVYLLSMIVEGLLLVVLRVRRRKGTEL